MEEVVRGFNFLLDHGLTYYWVRRTFSTGLQRRSASSSDCIFRAYRARPSGRRSRSRRQSVSPTASASSAPSSSSPSTRSSTARSSRSSTSPFGTTTATVRPCASSSFYDPQRGILGASASPNAQLGLSDSSASHTDIPHFFPCTAGRLSLAASSRANVRSCCAKRIAGELLTWALCPFPCRPQRHPGEQPLQDEPGLLPGQDQGAREPRGQEAPGPHPQARRHLEAPRRRRRPGRARARVGRDEPARVERHPRRDQA